MLKNTLAPRAKNNILLSYTTFLQSNSIISVQYIY